MDSLSIALLIVILTSMWGGFVFILKKMDAIEKGSRERMDKLEADHGQTGQTIVQICEFLRTALGFESRL